MWFKTEEGFKHMTSCLHLQLFQKRITLARLLASNEPARLDSFNNAGYNNAHQSKMGIHTYMRSQSCRTKEGFPLSCNPYFGGDTKF